METKAPTGYTLNKSPYRIEFTDFSMNDAGQLEKYTVTVTDPDGTSVVNTYEAIYNTDGSLMTFKVLTNGGKIIQTKIINTKISALPSTGGIGTTIFTVGGIGLIAAALIIFMKRKNQDAGQ